MERDRDTVEEHYAYAVPGALDALSPEERHQLYKLLRLEMLAYPDKSLEVSGAIVGGAPDQPEDGGARPGGGSPDGSVPGGELGALESTQTSSRRPQTDLLP